MWQTHQVPEHLLEVESMTFSQAVGQLFLHVFRRVFLHFRRTSQRIPFSEHLGCSSTLDSRCDDYFHQNCQSNVQAFSLPQVQFERCGFFALDRKATKESRIAAFICEAFVSDTPQATAERGSLVFNCTVAQRSTV